MDAASTLVARASTYSTDPEVNRLFLQLQAETAAYVQDAYPQTSNLMRIISGVLRFYLAAEHGYSHFLQYRVTVGNEYERAESLASSIMYAHQAVRQRLTDLDAQIRNASTIRRQDADKAKMDADELFLKEQDYRRQAGELDHKSEEAGRTARELGEKAHQAEQYRQTSHIAERQAREALNRNQEDLNKANDKLEEAQDEYQTASNEAYKANLEADECDSAARRYENEADDLEEEADGKKSKAKAVKVGAVFALATAVFDGGSHSAAWATGATALGIAAKRLKDQARAKRQDAANSRSKATARRTDGRNWAGKANYWQGQANKWGGKKTELQGSITTLTSSIATLQEQANQYELWVKWYEIEVNRCNTERDLFQRNSVELLNQAHTCRENANKANIDERNLRSQVEKLDAAINELGHLTVAVDNVSNAVQQLGNFVSKMRRRLRDTRDDAHNVEDVGLFNVLKSSAGTIIEICDAYRDLEYQMDRVKDSVLQRR